MDREENELGVSCIAVPVFDIHGRVPYRVDFAFDITSETGGRKIS